MYSGAQESVNIDQYGLPDLFVTNCVSPYLFNRTLIPILTATAKEDNSDVRIVNLSSGIHARARPTSLEGKTSISGPSDTVWSFPKRLELYGLCKLAVLLHTKQLQRVFAAESIPITCLAVNPGAINTVGATSFLGSIPYVSFALKLLGRYFFGTWRDGAMNVAWAAAGREINEAREHYYGKYVVPVAQISPPSAEASDERLARELWETLESIINEMIPS
ncbi:hypothetical protein CVT24_007309 [Panaeolus cyanescens]|uniref:Uncharacterized protein n=1 Tax=Panaeolus cyanescens TaxID=181874 RepID=A0A409XAK5_9AGAR|nr:hypothetical protein CVT24_007309 [Panaeolus cyanescens]